MYLGAVWFGVQLGRGQAKQAASFIHLHVLWGTPSVQGWPQHSHRISTPMHPCRRELAEGRLGFRGQQCDCFPNCLHCSPVFTNTSALTATSHSIPFTGHERPRPAVSSDSIRTMYTKFVHFMKIGRENTINFCMQNTCGYKDTCKAKTLHKPHQLYQDLEEICITSLPYPILLVAKN